MFKNPKQKEEREKVSYREQPTGRLGTDDSPVLRLVVGLIFIAHGGQKPLGQGLGGVAGTTEGLGIPASAEFAVALVLVELVGGAALILGFFTRLFAVPLTFTWQLYFDDALTDEVHLQGFLPVGDEIRR